MISSLRGVVAGFGPTGIELEVGGIGYLINVPSPMLLGLRIGQKLRIVTHLVVREDSLTMFGFGSTHQRELFQMLIAVTGVGPRLALAIISVFQPEELRRVVATADVGALTSVSGIGKRGAERILVELKERLGAPIDSGAGATSKVAEVREALVGLGYAPIELREVLDRVSSQNGSDEEEVGQPSVEEMVKAALQELARI